MKSDAIKQIRIDTEGRVCVQPNSKSFEYIYRSAMGIYWNSTEGFLYPRIIAVWSPADWFNQILAAVRNEYGCELLITPGTEWINVDQATREKIEEKYRKSASPPPTKPSHTITNPPKPTRPTPSLPT